jgi:cell division protein FtsB
MWKMFKMTPNRLWIGIFCLWLVFLSGIAGAPGVIQAVKLSSLLQSKHAQVTVAQVDISKLETDIALLETSRVVQEREVRRVLGYAGNDEIIFDFTGSEPSVRAER